MGRRPELATVRLRSMDMGRVKDTSHERLSKWFADLKSVIDEFNISIENIYNMDESRFAIGTIERSVTIINSEIRTRLQRANPGRQEWVTSVECICADGTALLPLIIFKAENLSHEWIPADTPQDWAFSCNSKGWTSNQHGLEWLQRCFDPATRAKAGNQFRMLICDGHDSHISGNFVEHCMNN
jgi:DDE superfamily endonuclease